MCSSRICNKQLHCSSWARAVPRTLDLAGHAGQGRAGQARQGRAGQGRAGQGRAGQTGAGLGQGQEALGKKLCLDGG